jgi:hypothetical protein
MECRAPLACGEDNRMSAAGAMLPTTQTEGEESTMTITFLTKDDIASRREELLSAAGLGLEELRSRQAAFQLSPEQALILKELEDLEYLASA